MDTRTAIVTGESSGIGLALAQAHQSRHRCGHAYLQRPIAKHRKLVWA